MTSVIEGVIALASKHSGLPEEGLSAQSAIYHDIGLLGDDLDLFRSALAEKYGNDILAWPWARFTNLNEPNLWTAVVAIVQLPMRMLFKRRNPRSKYERLELGHIAAVIETGQWRNP